MTNDASVSNGPTRQTDDERVKSAIEDIALNPDRVGLTHAKILRDEIVRLRSQIATLVVAKIHMEHGHGQRVDHHELG